MQPMTRVHAKDIGPQLVVFGGVHSQYACQHPVCSLTCEHLALRAQLGHIGAEHHTHKRQQPHQRHHQQDDVQLLDLLKLVDGVLLESATMVIQR
jgi:hypothetical protein